MGQAEGEGDGSRASAGPCSIRRAGARAALESRVLLNASPAARLAAHHVAHHGKPVGQERRSSCRGQPYEQAATPAEKINKAYANFLSAFNNMLSNYVQSINEQSTGLVSVSTTVQGDYSTPPLPSTILVADASVFGPEGDYSSAVTATAVLGPATLGTVYITGSSGNYLIITPAIGTATTLPSGTTLAASVPTSAQTSAMSIFPSYITNSTIQLAIGLVQYFNNLPIKLPPENAPPHTPVQRGAIQYYVYQNIASSLSTSLKQLLLAIPLPTTPGSDLQIYQSAVDSAVAQSNQQILDGVQQIFNRTLLVNAQEPANRLGEDFNSSSGSSTGSTVARRRLHPLAVALRPLPPEEPSNTVAKRVKLSSRPIPQWAAVRPRPDICCTDSRGSSLADTVQSGVEPGVAQ